MNASGSLFEQHFYTVSDWLGDANAWMMAALRADDVSRRAEHVGKDDASDLIDTHMLNIAYVCTGTAFELAYKALAVSESIKFEWTNSIEDVHNLLGSDTQASIESWAKRQGWDTVERMLTFLDSEMVDPNRKYRMRDPINGTSGSLGFVYHATASTIPDLATVLFSITHLGIERCSAQRQQKRLAQG